MSNVIQWRSSSFGLYQAGHSFVMAVTEYWLPRGEKAIRDAVREVVDMGHGTREAYDNVGVMAHLIMLAEWGAASDEVRTAGSNHLDCPEFHRVSTNEWCCGSHSVESDGYRARVEKVRGGRV